MPKICHVSSGHNVLDDRIFFKEASSLALEYETHVIAMGECNDLVNHVHIHALKKGSTRFHRFILVQLKLLFMSLKLNADVYHFHDPDLILFGLIQKMLGKKVVYDMHELVYFQINDKQWLGYDWLKKNVARVYLFFERLAVRYFNQIVIAEDGYWEYVNQMHAKHIKKFKAIRNFSIYGLIEKVNPSQFVKKDGNSILVYAGGLSRIRGIKEIVQAVQSIPNINFICLGSWESDQYQKECVDADSTDKMNYLGLVKMNEVYSYLKVADIGIANLYPKPNYLTSLPIKAFEYMASGLPIIMSDFPYWKETFGKCALFVDPTNIDEIRSQIEKLMQDAFLRESLAKAGKELVLEKYTWEAESTRLKEMYKEIINDN